MTIDSILTEWTFRLESGYPTCDADYDVLHDVIMEMTDLSETDANRIVTQARGLNEDEEDIIDDPIRNLNPTSKQDDLADLITSIKTKDKTSQLELLANYTAEHYPAGWISKLSGTSGIFMVNDIIDNEYFGIDVTAYSNAGESIEAVLFKYISENTNETIEHINDRGTDGMSDNYEYEVKSFATSFDIKLQTTFFSNDPNKYYLFVKRDGAGYKYDTFKVYIIASQLLRKISLGNEIYKEIEQTNASKILKQQIQDGLTNLNFEEQISSVILTGQTGEYEKQFSIGNNVSVRFLIFIEPKKF